MEAGICAEMLDGFVQNSAAPWAALSPEMGAGVGVALAVGAIWMGPVVIVPVAPADGDVRVVVVAVPGEVHPACSSATSARDTMPMRFGHIRMRSIPFCSAHPGQYPSGQARSTRSSGCAGAIRSARSSILIHALERRAHGTPDARDLGDLRRRYSRHLCLKQRISRRLTLFPQVLTHLASSQPVLNATPHSVSTCGP